MILLPFLQPPANHTHSLSYCFTHASHMTSSGIWQLPAVFKPTCIIPCLKKASVDNVDATCHIGQSPTCQCCWSTSLLANSSNSSICGDCCQTCNRIIALTLPPILQYSMSCQTYSMHVNDLILMPSSQ